MPGSRMPMPQPVTLPVAQAYDRWSGTYDTYDNPMVFMARAALRAMVGKVQLGTVIEFGCGTGQNLSILKDAGATRLIGLDFSDGMLAKARALGVTHEFLQHDITLPVPLPDGDGDCCLFSLSLEHVPDLGPVLREAARLLRPGGRVMIIEIHPFLALGGTKAHFHDGGAEIEMPTFSHQFASYLTAFRLAGLQLQDCREWRPVDVGGALPAKVLKRGAQVPLVVAFELCRSES